MVVKTPKCISFDNSYLIKFDQIVCSSDWKRQQWKLVNIWINKYLKESRAVVEVGRLEALAHSPIGAVESAVLSRKHLPRSLPCPCLCRCCCHCRFWCTIASLVHTYPPCCCGSMIVLNASLRLMGKIKTKTQKKLIKNTD